MVDALIQVPAPSPNPMDLAEWWDIVNALAQSLGAVGTAGALLIAALGYRRQVEGQRRELASLVVFRYVETTSEGVWLEATNRGTLPVRAASVVIDVGRPETASYGFISMGRMYEQVEGDGHFRPSGDIGNIDPGASVRLVGPHVVRAYGGGLHRDQEATPSVSLGTSSALLFLDSHGRLWIRSVSGKLGPARQPIRRIRLHRCQRWFQH